MKVSLSGILQNVLSGCVGGLLVIGVAHAAEQAKTTPTVIKANEFVLTDDQGVIRGKWEIDKGTARFGVLDATGEHSASLSANATGSRLMVIGARDRYCSAVVSDKFADVEASFGDSRRSRLLASPEIQMVAARGDHASVEVDDSADNERATLGYTQGAGKETTKPLSCVTLLDEAGRVIWQQH